MNIQQSSLHQQIRPSRDEALRHLERVLSSPGLRGAERMSHFLRYVVEQTLEGKGDRLKEYSIAVDVFGRDASFDPRVDSLVRVEAYRLRAKLRNYYENEGAGELIRISLPSGHYAVDFLTATDLPTGQPTDSHTGLRSTRDHARRSRFARAGWKWTVAVTLAGVLVVGLVVVRKWPRKQMLTASDVLVISDFVNSTGDRVFDDTLKQAVTIQLSQSPYIDILPDEKVRSTLELMTKPVGTKLTPDTALEVCLRSGSKAVIKGSIALVGAQYVIGLEAIDCQTGSALAREQIAAAAKEQVVGALGRAATKLRQKLGESFSSVQSFDVPLNEATTPSLEALKAFSVGLQKDLANDAEAVPFFKHAIELDPNFASAYEGLAVCYYNLGESGLARENFAKAFDLRQHVSERENFTIEARYYNYVSGDLEKAIEVYQLWTQAYPRSAFAHEDLGGLYGATGQFQKTIAETLIALGLEPHSGGSYANLILGYSALNRFDDAKSIYEKGVAQGVEDPVMHLNWFGVAFVQGDAAEMDRQLEWSAGRPEGEDLFLSAKSDTEAYFGHLALARKFSGQAVASAIRSGQKETAALWRMDEAVREAEFGNSKPAREEAKAALALNRNYDTEILAALVFARADDPAQAEALATDLSRRYPDDTLFNYYWLPVIRASAALDEHSPEHAIEILKATDPYEFASPGSWPALGGPLYPAFLRGVSYLRLGRADKASEQFQELIDHRGFMKASPLVPLARLGLARAYALGDDQIHSFAAFEDFLGMWHDADPNLSPLRQAEAEYTKLRMAARHK